MSCWHGHLPRMDDARLQQAIDEYYKMYGENWRRAWQSPLNPWRDEPTEPTSLRSPRPPSRAGLQAARPRDKAGAIDVEFVRVR